MRTISQRELRNDNAAVMDAVERGETFRITRHGTAVAELRPLDSDVFVGTAGARRALGHLPAGGLERQRTEADAVLGSDRLGG